MKPAVAVLSNAAAPDQVGHPELGGRPALDRQALRSRIEPIQGSSVERSTVDEVRGLIATGRNPTIVLDSNHAYEHVALKLELYAPLVRKGGYLVVLDTIVDDMPADFSAGRPWPSGAGSKRAVVEYLATTNRFVIDEAYTGKLLVSAVPDGFLKCVADL